MPLLRYEFLAGGGFAVLYIICAASKALENVVEPSPVKQIPCQRCLKRLTGILSRDYVLSDPQIIGCYTYLGLS